MDLQGDKLYPDENSYSQDKFIYDEKNDCFTCPNGNTLSRMGQYDHNGKIMRAYYTMMCKDCQSREKCAGTSKIRLITRNSHEPKKESEKEIWLDEEEKGYQKLGIIASVSKYLKKIKFNIGNVGHNLITLFKKPDKIQIKLKETETLELKKSTLELTDGIISIVSVLNKHQQGELYFGVTNNGDILGQDVSETTIQNVSKAISDNIEPKIFSEVTKKEFDGKQCILVRFEGTEIPYFAFGKAYMRAGCEDRQMSEKDIERLILEKNETVWERGISDKSIEDINSKTMSDFIERANIANRINFKFTDTESTLNKINLVNNGRLLKAAEVLFCDENPYEVQAAVFAGKDKLTFLDIRQFKGNIFNLMKQSEDYIKEHINWRAKLESDGREEIPEIPLRAITEAVVNSMCHRDYTNLKGNEVAIFKDRIEIYNPGRFPEGYEPEDFISGEEKSVLRNPLIANTLYLSGDVERWSSGLKRIYTVCKEEGIGVEFKKIKSGFVVVFYRKVTETTPTTPETTLETTPQTLPKTTPKTEETLLSLIRQNPRITKEDIAKELGITVDGVKYHMKKMRNNGIVCWVGPSKSGHWEIKENMGKDEGLNQK